MKLSSLILCVFLMMFLAACHESEMRNISDSDRQFFRDREATKCLASSDKSYEDYFEESNKELLKLEREDAWKFVIKRDNTVTSSADDKIIVWKVSKARNAVYFLFKTTVNGSLSNKFYKITTQNNEDMFKDLQLKSCSKLENLKINFSSSKITVTKEYDAVTQSDDTKKDQQLVYDYTSKNLPALFGYLGSKTTFKILKKDGSVQSTEVYTRSFTSIREGADLPNNLPSDGNVPNQYCVLVFAPANPSDPKTRANYGIPYTEKCETSTSAIIDADGDGVTDFNPATEL